MLVHKTFQLLFPNISNNFQPLHPSLPLARVLQPWSSMVTDTEIRKPISEKQLAANRANATKSTGPRTEAGRARSAQNALIHGFTASRFCIIRGEDPQELDNLKADFLHTYRPANHAERKAVERIALAQWSIERCYQLEAGLFTSFADSGLHQSDLQEDFLHPDLTENFALAKGQGFAYILASGFHAQAKREKNFSLFLRYKSQVERDYRRAVEEWERVRKLRDELAEFPNEPISEPLSPIPVTESPEPDSPNEPISTEPASDPQPLTPDPQLPNEPISAPDSPAPDPWPPAPASEASHALASLESW